jgi:DNA end-binding protein Ku
MAARATSSGTISFGLVSIPVKLYAATRSKSVHFNMLHDKDKSRLKQQYVCSTCGDVVDRSDTVRGYEYSRGQYVVLTEDEIKSVEKKTDRSIEIEEFIPIDEVDPIFFDRSNLLGPDKGGHKAYRLLQKAMQDAGRVALGRFSTRGRQQLVLLRPSGEGLVMHALYYADEVRGFDDVEMGEPVEVRKGELELAQQLIEQLGNDRFEPRKYEDDYRQALLEMVDRKVAGEEIVTVEAPEAREQIIDLVEALKKSLGEERGAAASGGKRVRKAAKAKGRKKAARRKSAG